VSLHADDLAIAPVRILDAQGQVVAVVSAADFRRTHPRDAASQSALTVSRRQRRGKVEKPTQPIV